MKIRSLLLATLLLASASSALAVTHTVNNAADFNALPSLNAGDVVVLNSGTYGSLNKTLVSTIATDALAQSNPIYVYAATPGGVDVTAPSQITLQGRGIILAGLDFVSGSGMLANGDDTPVWIIKTDANSRHMTISNVRFLNCTAGDNYGHWLYLEGFNHTVEYCSFEGKNEPNRNATVAFKRHTSEAGITTPRNHVLRYCYFGPREASNASGSTGNGYETIRIGDSSSQAHDMNVTIAHNVFYRAIWRNDGAKPNDMEIISNKSKGNKILHNTFLESYGQLTLRHGDACLVEGNYILGGGYYSGSSILLNAANPHQTGIRIIGTDHVVRNNFLINLAGTNLRAALCLMGGESSHTDGNGSGGYNGYEAAHNAQIYNNTFVDCTELNLGYRSAGTVSPTGVQIYNNVWQGSGTSNGIVRSNSFTPAGSGGNYIYHPSGSYGWTGLTGGTYTSSASPQVTESFDNYKRPTSGSPLLNAASTTLVAGDDIRGLTRPSTDRDIGSYEREVSGSGFRPLLRNEVGPEFDGGPGETYPTPPPADTTPDITTTTLPGATVGVSYSQTLAVTSGEAPYTWSISAGALPAGLTLNSSSGELSGTPTSAGTATFTARVQDSDGDFDTQALSLVVSAPAQVATPSFSPAGGTYSSAQSVTISSATSGATIRYTTNGTNPTSSSGTIYSGAINLSVTTTLKAIAYASGMTDSAIATATYTISAGDPEVVPIAAPDSTPWDTAGSNGPACLYDGVTADGGNASRWASNASPDTLSTAPRSVVLDLGASHQLSKIVLHPYQSRAYHYEIYVSDNTSAWGTAVVNVQQSTGAASYTHTVSATGRYVRLVVDGISGSTSTWASINELDLFGTAVPTVATPTFSPAGGTYSSAQAVTISTATSGAAIRYTTDGSTPTASTGTLYSGAVNIAATTTLKAIAYAGGMADSAVATATYTIAGGGTGAFLMSADQVVMDAENANSRTAGGGKNWTNITLSGASGAASDNAIQALANSGTTASAPGTGTPRADYQIVVPSGSASTFYVHVRANGPSGSDDSIYISVNGSTSTYQSFTTTGALGWKRANNTITLPAGTQTLTLWMREDGTILDKIVINTSTTLPTGTGPMESARQ